VFPSTSLLTRSSATLVIVQPQRPCVAGTCKKDHTIGSMILVVDRGARGSMSEFGLWFVWSNDIVSMPVMS